MPRKRVDARAVRGVPNDSASRSGRRPRGTERQRTHYKDFFDLAPVPFVLLDALGIIRDVNAACARLLNAGRSRLVGHPLLRFVVDGDRSELLEHLRRCRGNGTVESEIRLLDPGGRPVTCRLHSKRVRTGTSTALPSVIVDQTDRLALDDARLLAERRRDEAERTAEIARSASAAKDRFLNTISHELRTPLTPALFAASQLAAWDGVPEAARKLAATIKRNIEFEAKLIDDLLDLARINRERITLRREPVDIHDVVGEAIRTVQPIAEAKQIEVTSRCAAASRLVEGDRARLRQVFWNLLSNAIKFTDPGGRIVVRSSNVSDTIVRISVEDSGIGMDAPLLETLFTPFDGRRTHHESRAGLGLGLAICKGIVAAHGGQIWAASDGPGRGSTFAVELETSTFRHVEGASDDATSTPFPAGAPQACDGLRVLVVEDDADSSEMLRLLLSRYGYHVEVASSLDTGLRRLAEGWDVVLSDIGLPDGSGLEIARRAKNGSARAPRLIALSGYGSNDDVNASRKAGFDDHVVKPVELARLLTAMGGAHRRSTPSQ